ERDDQLVRQQHRSRPEEMPGEAAVFLHDKGPQVEAVLVHQGALQLTDMRAVAGVNGGAEMKVFGFGTGRHALSLPGTRPAARNSSPLRGRRRWTPRAP